MVLKMAVWVTTDMLPSYLSTYCAQQVQEMIRSEHLHILKRRFEVTEHKKQLHYFSLFCMHVCAHVLRLVVTMMLNQMWLVVVNGSTWYEVFVIYAFNGCHRYQPLSFTCLNNFCCKLSVLQVDVQLLSWCVDVEYVLIYIHLQRGGKMGPGRMTLKEFVAFFQDHFADQYMVLTPNGVVCPISTVLSICVHMDVLSV